MKNLKYLLILLLFTSCELREDGYMSVNGQVVRMFYFYTDEDLNLIKNNLIEILGEPKFLDKHKNTLLYENIDFYQFNNLTIQINVTAAYKIVTRADGIREHILDHKSVSFAFTDSDNNDLLMKGTDSRKVLKKHVIDLKKRIL